MIYRGRESACARMKGGRDRRRDGWMLSIVMCVSSHVHHMFVFHVHSNTHVHYMFVFHVHVITHVL